MLKIEQIYIEGINGINELNLTFNPGFNFISGSNGIGKTTILECIASSFNRHIKNVRRNVKYDYGSWNLVCNIDESILHEWFTIDDFHTGSKRKRFPNTIKSKEFINFAITRTGFGNTVFGNPLESIQSWFFQNYYFENKLSEKQYYNLKIAQKCFTMLDPTICFSKVIERDLNEKDYHGYRKRPVLADIYVETFGGEIPLDYLSSGYKSCLIMLLKIIKQTEVTSAVKEIHSFEGVILIDELDLHLHPEWQAKLIDILRWLVPKAQIIATTHSPHIIQVAAPNEITALGYSKEGDVIKRDVASNEYGFQGWSVEEILTDVMGLKDTYSDVYLEALNEFEEALSNFDGKRAKEIFDEIDKMLHPRNHLRKILRIQMAPLETNSYD